MTNLESFVGKAFWLIVIALIVVGILLFFGKVGNDALFYVLGVLNAYVVGKAALSQPGNGKPPEVPPK